MKPFVFLSLFPLLFLAPEVAAGEPGPEAEAPAAVTERSDEEAPGSSPLDRLLAEIQRGVEAPPETGATPRAGGAPSAGGGGLPSGVELLSGGGGGGGDGGAAGPAGGLPASLDAQALEELLRTGEAPVLGTPTHRVFPHGHRVPVVRCLPLHACDLVFEAGERLTGWALGDSQRWRVEAMTSGAGETARPHLLLKPVDYELATNLVVLTDRRAYRLELESPSHDEVHEREEGEAPAAYDLTLSWWYPDEWVQRRRLAAAEDAAARAEAAERHRRAVALERRWVPEELSFDYEIEVPWRRSRRLPWRPVTVFDDGRQVYLRLPEAARRGELPVLLGLLEDGGHYPLNTRVEGEWLIVPVLFERAELVLGTGDRRRSLAVVAGREGDG